MTVSRTLNMGNGATVADWLGTAEVAAKVGAMYLADVRNGVAGAGRLQDARAQLTQALEELDAVLERLECPGHPADAFSPMGETRYCDGSCQA